MTSKSQLILHVATEAFVIASVSIFFTKKINTLTRSIDEMATHIQHITSKLEEQEKMIQMLSDKIVKSEITKRQTVNTPRSSPVLNPQPPPSHPTTPVRKRQEDVIFLNLFNPLKQQSTSKPVIELMDDEKTSDQLDTEIKAELLDLDMEIRNVLSPIKEEEEIYEDIYDGAGDEIVDEGEGDNLLKD
jgi:hypothetical protein